MTFNTTKPTRRTTLAAGGAGLLALAAAAFAAPDATAAPAVPALPFAASGDAFLTACAEFIRLEGSYFDKLQPNGDFVDSHVAAIVKKQKPLRNIICNTPDGGRADYRAARARCLVAGEPELADGRMSDEGVRLLQAIIRDALAA